MYEPILNIIRTFINVIENVFNVLRVSNYWLIHNIYITYVISKFIPVSRGLSRGLYINLLNLFLKTIFHLICMTPEKSNF